MLSETRTDRDMTEAAARARMFVALGNLFQELVEFVKVLRSKAERE